MDMTSPSPKDSQEPLDSPKPVPMPSAAEMSPSTPLPIVAAIVAMDRNRLIGVDGDLPWRLPADLAWFKRTTMNKPIVMGRKTHESIGRPLPGRTNVVLTRDLDYRAEGCEVVHTVDAALAVDTGDANEIMIIGGAQIYALFLSRMTRLYRTLVDGDFDGDTWFPELDESEWTVMWRERFEPDEKNPRAYEFSVLGRGDATGG